MKAYTLAITASGADYNESSLQLKRATELDPQFAAAWSLPRDRLQQLRRDEALRAEAATRAFQARERASGPEKFNIDYSYHRNVTGNLEKAWDAVSLWRDTYPRDAKAFSLSAGYAANGTARYEQALEAAAKGITIDHDHIPSYANRSAIFFRLGKFEEAVKANELAAAHHAASGDLIVIRYRLALLAQDRAAIEKLESESKGINENEIVMSQIQALAAAREGRLDDAEKYSRRAIEMARRTGRPERAAVFQAASAVWNAFYGKRDAARQEAEAALKAFDGREVAYAAGFALGLAGDAARAETLAAKLNQDHREDTQVQATYVPTLQALAALAKNDPRRAIELLEANRHYEFAVPPLAFNHFYGNMYPLYVRGLAFLALNKREEAAAEFSRLIAHPGLAAGDPVDAAARWQLVRALAEAGERSKAKSAYEDVMTLWKNADPDIPIATQTKALLQ